MRPFPRARAAVGTEMSGPSGGLSEAVSPAPSGQETAASRGRLRTRARGSAAQAVARNGNRPAIPSMGMVTSAERRLGAAAADHPRATPQRRDAHRGSVPHRTCSENASRDADGQCPGLDQPEDLPGPARSRGSGPGCGSARTSGRGRSDRYGRSERLDEAERHGRVVRQNGGSASRCSSNLATITPLGAKSSKASPVESLEAAGQVPSLQISVPLRVARRAAPGIRSERQFQISGVYHVAGRGLPDTSAGTPRSPSPSPASAFRRV